MARRKIVSEADIGRVRDQLDLAIASLVEGGPDQSGVGRLQEAARLLEEIRQAAASEPLSPALAAALRGLAPRTARAGQLLDSAAAFYRGWWQVSPAPAEDYTPDGSWVSAAARSTASLSLEA